MCATIYQKNNALLAQGNEENENENDYKKKIARKITFLATKRVLRINICANYFACFVFIIYVVKK